MQPMNICNDLYIKARIPNIFPFSSALMAHHQLSHASRY